MPVVRNDERTPGRVAVQRDGCEAPAEVGWRRGDLDAGDVYPLGIGHHRAVSVEGEVEDTAAIALAIRGAAAEQALRNRHGLLAAAGQVAVDLFQQARARAR